jgi:hypothetical protein
MSARANFGKLLDRVADERGSLSPSRTIGGDKGTCVGDNETCGGDKGEIGERREVSPTPDRS